MKNTIKLASNATTIEMVIGVHSGAMHPDDAVACYLVQRGLNCKIIRTRDEYLLSTCNIVVDVGGVYQPNEDRYDHHQFNKNHPSVGYSSAGLIYQTMELQHPFLDAFIAHVDSRDTRVDYDPDNKHDAFCEALIRLNDINIMSDDQDLAFIKAIEYVKAYINELLDDVEYPEFAELQAQADLNDRFKAEEFALRRANTITDGVAIYGQWYPQWKEDVKDNLFVTKGDIVDEYKVMCNTDELKIISSKDEVFTHKGGFISIIKPKNSRECMVTVEVYEDQELIDIHFDVLTLRTAWTLSNRHKRAGDTHYHEYCDAVQEWSLYVIDYTDEGMKYNLVEGSGSALNVTNNRYTTLSEFDYDQEIDQVNKDNRPTHRVFYTPVGSDYLEFVMEGTLEECRGCAECKPYSEIFEITN